MLRPLLLASRSQPSAPRPAAPATLSAGCHGCPSPQLSGGCRRSKTPPLSELSEQNSSAAIALHPSHPTTPISFPFPPSPIIARLARSPALISLPPAGPPGLVTRMRPSTARNERAQHPRNPSLRPLIPTPTRPARPAPISAPPLL
ncbi:hypothetical protein BS50DRAFT_404949 [Corynespora cassiicola Philippines]|uniref:Uncharacterized protein n=1 Tax=Corynespora cassiicola Philippines TaxID=1448308 RepID=A0A2T2NLW7_CORCC|nr:hypothetical protein BS50DRAFT_404949 [Corynespora cassiicola Philippines]